MRALLLTIALLAACSPAPSPMINVTAHSGVRPTSAFGGGSFAPNPGNNLAGGSGTLSGPVTIRNAAAGTAGHFALALLALDSDTTTFQELAVHNSALGSPALAFIHTRGTHASPSATLSGDYEGSLEYGGFGVSTYGEGASINALATQTWTESAHGSQLVFSTVPNGSITVTPALTIGQDQSLTPVGPLIETVQAAACSAGVLALDPVKNLVEIDANGAACVVTLGEANANVGRTVTITITATPGAGLVTFPDVANKHLGPTLCTTTGVGLGAVYTIYYAGTLNEYVGKSCTVNQ